MTAQRGGAWLARLGRDDDWVWIRPAVNLTNSATSARARLETNAVETLTAACYTRAPRNRFSRDQRHVRAGRSSDPRSARAGAPRLLRARRLSARRARDPAAGRAVP